MLDIIDRLGVFLASGTSIYQCRSGGGVLFSLLRRGGHGSGEWAPRETPVSRQDVSLSSRAEVPRPL